MDCGAKKLCKSGLCGGPRFPGGVGVVFQLPSMGEPGFLLEQSLL